SSCPRGPRATPRRPRSSPRSSGARGNCGPPPGRSCGGTWCSGTAAPSPGRRRGSSARAGRRTAPRSSARWGGAPSWRGRARVGEAIAALLAGASRAGADFLPLVGTGLLSDEQALAVLAAAWRELAARPPAERIPVIEALVGRRALLDAARPPKESLSIL